MAAGLSPGAVTLINSTVAGNSATYRGGGISGTATARNSIIALNTASSDPDINGSLASGSQFNLTGIDPLFVGDPASGVTAALRLSADSPAINAGSNSLAVDAEGSPLATDLDGKPRIIYATVDIGAYEYRRCRATRVLMVRWTTSMRRSSGAIGGSRARAGATGISTATAGSMIGTRRSWRRIGGRRSSRSRPASRGNRPADGRRRRWGV